MIEESHIRSEGKKKSQQILEVFGEGVYPVFSFPDSADTSYLNELGWTKRFMERWSLDQDFRKRLETEPQKAADELGYPVDTEALRPLWDEAEAKKLQDAIKQGADVAIIPPAAHRYRAFTCEKLAYREILKSHHQPSPPLMQSWRERQINRCLSELGPSKSVGIVHSPVAFELQKGCSVGCWFCGVGAEKFTGHFEYTPDNATLWKDVLQVCSSLIGPAAANGFCYWASDPLDNPDYEKLISDYHSVMGRYPQTTTAIPLRDPERVNRLNKMTLSEGSEINRFSILHLRMLKEVHEAFTPEELLFVELLPLNKESGTAKVNAGKARTVNPKNQAKAPEEQSSTIACVSGFLFNMYENTVRLITPCNASKQWPNGYKVLEEGHFKNGQDLHDLMSGMIDRNMKAELAPEDRICWRPDVTWEKSEKGYAATSFWIRRFPRPYPELGALGDLITSGNMTCMEIALAMEEHHGVELPQTMIALDEFFSLGLLDEDQLSDAAESKTDHILEAASP